MGYSTSRPTPPNTPLTPNTVTGAASTIISSTVSPSRVLISDNSGRVSTSLTSSDDVDKIRGGTTRNTVVTPEDGDGLLMNDNGTMMQIAFSRVWEYIKNKMSGGAVSGLLTTNLTANREIRTDSNGKIVAVATNQAGMAIVSDAGGMPTATTTTADEIRNIRGAVTDSGVTIDDADRFVHNDGGTMKQTSFTRIFEWMKTKLAGAISTVLTTNLTASRILVSDSSGKIAVSTAGSSVLSNLGAFVGISKFLAQARPGTGSTVVTVMTASMRAITIDLEFTATATNVRAFHDTTSSMQLYKLTFSGTGVTTSRSLVTNGSTIATMSNATANNTVVEGIVYADGSTTEYVNFRLYMMNPTTTAGWIKIDVW